MAYDVGRDFYRSQTPNGAARNFYLLTNAMIGAAELPAYGRAFRIRLGSTATPPCVMVVVPIGEMLDANTVTITVDTTDIIPFGIRRIVSLNGGATVPTGVEIQIVTV